VTGAGAASEAPHTLLQPRIALPFILVCLIWGSTWLVITDQIDDVPASWSVTYRFMLATPAMFLVALLTRKRLALGRNGQLLAIFMGATQFCGNFNFVYRAELHLTSGIVALMIGLLLVPNAVLGRFLLGQPITRNFALGSAIAIGGLALLLLHEARIAPVGGNVWLGIVFGLIAMLCASLSNVVQANETGRALPMVSLLAWAMLYGTVIDFAVAWATSGAPVLPTRAQYWAGTVFLAVCGSVVTFPLYYTLIRQLGAGRAAYTGVVVVVIAMGLSTLFEGYRWSLLSISGSVLAMVGLVVALRARNPALKSR